jgi:hypothetical protein
MYKSFAIKNILQRNKIALICIGVFATLGLATLLLTRAATPVVNLEPENGTLSAGAASISDTSASGGKAVQFKTGTVTPPPPPPPPVGGSVTIAAVGDMNPSGNTSASSNSGKNAAAIIAGLNNGSLAAFFALGDLQYDQGTCSELVNGWAKLWGPAVPKMYTITGPTHDVASASDELGHKLFMNGQCPGSTAKSAAVQLKGSALSAFEPYSFDIGTWHFAMLPTSALRYTSSAGSSVASWLDADLAKAKTAGKNLGVAYHDPYFTSKTSSHDRETAVKPWVDVIDKYDVRLTLSGSQHNYERSCPVLANDSCTADNGTGTTAFNVSTGGIGLRAFTSNPSYIVKKFSDTYGWMKLTLNADGSFSWQYMPVSGTGTDSGTRVKIGG